MMTLTAELVYDAGAELGESPTWDPRDGRLAWIDYTGRMLHRFDPGRELDTATPYELEVGAVAPRAAGGFVASVGTGFGFLDPESGAIEFLGELEDPTVTAMNDGKCDPTGRFWAGTYVRDENAPEPVGALYRLESSLEVTRVLGGVLLSNGLGWSTDGETMYYIDSLTRRVDAFDYDAAGGAIANRRTLIRFEDGPKVLPDGMTVDVEGCLWVAFWGGSRVERISPEGVRQAVIEVPATYVTSCAFGGDDLADLYVTTAIWDLSAEQRRREPHAGGLFRARPGVAGTVQPLFAG